MSETVLVHHTAKGDPRGFVAFTLAPGVGLEDFMPDVRHLFDVQGEPREYSRTPDGHVTYHVPVLPKAEVQ